MSAVSPEPVVRYHDEDILVVDKPSGLPTQATRRDRKRHLFGWLQAQEHYVGLHHRLDTPASGLLLFARNRRVNKAIARALGDGSMKRDYLIATVGDPGPAGCWDQDLDGRRARSHWKRRASQAGMSLLEVRLETGRTHQIRRHAVDAGFPIVGDRRYGGRAGSAYRRLALHAWTLSFPHPRTKRLITVRSPVPADLEALFRQAGWEPENDPASTDPSTTDRQD